MSQARSHSDAMCASASAVAPRRRHQVRPREIVLISICERLHKAHSHSTRSTTRRLITLLGVIRDHSMRPLILTTACAAAVLGACAKDPDSIAPSYISDVAYRPLSCQDLAIEASRLNGALSSASTQQEQARTNDAVGVFWLGLPVSSLSGDNVAPEIARLKGEIEAVNRAAMAKKCATA